MLLLVLTSSLVGGAFIFGILVESKTSEMLAEKPLSSFLAAFIIGALLTTCSS